MSTITGLVCFCLGDGLDEGAGGRISGCCVSPGPDVGSEPPGKNGKPASRGNPKPPAGVADLTSRGITNGSLFGN